VVSAQFKITDWLPNCIFQAFGYVAKYMPFLLGFFCLSISNSYLFIYCADAAFSGNKFPVSRKIPDIRRIAAPKTPLF